MSSPRRSPPAPVKNIVLVHGAFADGSSWSKVIPQLSEMGYHAVAVQNPRRSGRAPPVGRHSLLIRPTIWLMYELV